jgi:hypothetical protein
MTQNLHQSASVKLPTFASLLNQKIVILSDSSDYIAVDQYFFNDCLRPLIGKIWLDEGWYLQKYPDVRQAIAKKIVKDAKDHFVRFGYFEHRLPYDIKVQEDWYLEQYPDIKNAIERKEIKSGQQHFEDVGFREGRIPHPNFGLANGQP